MTVDVEAVIEYVGGNENDDMERAQRVLDTASELVNDFIGNAVVPDSVLDQAVLDTSAAVWHRQGSVSGAVNLGYDDQVAFVPNDVLRKSIPLLRRYVLPF